MGPGSFLRRGRDTCEADWPVGADGTEGVQQPLVLLDYSSAREGVGACRERGGLQRATEGAERPGSGPGSSGGEAAPELWELGHGCRDAGGCRPIHSKRVQQGVEGTGEKGGGLLTGQLGSM